MKDKIYLKPRKKIRPFSFDRKVARVFEDMINRSVPGYSDIVQMCGVLGARYICPKTRVYDLGCSLGAASRAVLHAVPDLTYELIAVDSSQAMIEKARKSFLKERRVVLKCADVETISIQNASLVMLNFVLQFISKEKRSDILEKIYTGLNPGGVLVLSEKIAFETLKENQIQTRLHEQFKRLRGYSDLEISQKRMALEKVLLPETLRVHENRLRRAGFRKIHVWFRCFNFISLLAIK